MSDRFEEAGLAHERYPSRAIVRDSHASTARESAMSRFETRFAGRGIKLTVDGVVAECSHDFGKCSERAARK